MLSKQITAQLFHCLMNSGFSEFEIGNDGGDALTRLVDQGATTNAFWKDVKWTNRKRSALKKFIKARKQWVVELTQYYKKEQASLLRAQQFDTHLAIESELG